MSSGKKKTTNTTVSTNDPPAWSVPYFQQALSQASNLASQPYVGYGGPTVAGFTQDQENAFNMNRAQAAQNGKTLANATNYVNGVINGDYANPYAGENPYLQSMIDAANKDITRNYSDVTLPSQLAQFNAGGAYGGSAMQQALTSGQRTLADQLSDTTTQLRSEDYNRQAQLYNQDQQFRLSALGQLGALQQYGYNDANQLARQGALQQALNQQAINDDREQFNEWRDWDANRLGLLTGALGSIRGGTSSNTSTGDNPNYKSAGENAAGYAALIASLYA